jgi:hypothetical protein
MVRMGIHRRDDMVASRTTTVASLVACCSLAAVGCAHHRADQYAYAPPYAPAVYPQPQVQMPAQPAAYAAAPAGVTPAGPVPAGAMPAGTVIAGPSQGAGGVVTAVGGECPPCASGSEGMIMPATLVEGGGQSPPCPPGP